MKKKATILSKHEYPEKILNQNGKKKKEKQHLFMTKWQNIRLLISNK